MDKEKNKEEKTVKKDYGAKKRTAAEEREKRFNVKAAAALKGFLKDNTVD